MTSSLPLIAFALYKEGFSGSDEVIAYCRIGERSSHTWFVLKYLLGYNNVRNYDGSWTGMGQPDRLADVNETASKPKPSGRIRAR